MAAWLTDVVVMAEAGGEGEQPERDAGAEAGESAGAVAFEPELAFAGPDDRFDPLADLPERPVAGLLVVAIGAQEARAEVCHEGLELSSREALVGDDGVAIEGARSSISARDFPLGLVGGGELEAIGMPSGAHSR